MTADPPMLLRRAVLAALLLGAAAPVRAQGCTGYLSLPRAGLHVSGGVDAAGDASAVGASAGRVGERYFAALDLAHRGYGLGGGGYRGPSTRRVETDHLFTGVSGGTITRLTPSGGVSLCRMAGVGLGFAYGDFPDRHHEGHLRGRVDVGVAASVGVGALRLLPSVGAGVVLVRETEFEDDIVISGGYPLAQVTTAVGIPLTRRVVVQPRAVVPLWSDYSPAFGVSAAWTVRGGR
ncbi:MAG: hypothetical protein KY444_08175 [Gemmatimonadetes bacterium]|nr:hypothetical protein [Gemmatimonadota bacterium]